jgi:hypothetical protein
MPHHENGFKKVETISMAFDPPAGRPAFAPAIVPDQRAEQRREWILSHSLPYLIDGVEQRDDPELQRASANTLARMGPYATPAVPQLAEALRKSDCPMQQSNLVEVFKQLGPDARPASADLENFADHCRKEVQPLARQALAAMHMPKWIGVRDMGHVLDDKARQRLDQRIHELSRRYHVHIVAETVRTMPAAARNVYSTFKPAEQAAYLTKFAQDRCQQLGADRGVYLFVCMDPPAIQVALGSETQSRHIPGWSPDAAKDSIDKTMKSRDYDKGLEEVVQMIEQAIKK